jgi:3-oxoacyl-[acyl-carrier protein] reductase
MADRLKGKASIVTGAGKGIGGGIAQVFAAEGAKVLVADLDEGAARATADELERAGAKAAALRVDVSAAADAEAMARAAIERFGRIDVLCQNAGIYPEAHRRHDRGRLGPGARDQSQRHVPHGQGVPAADGPAELRADRDHVVDHRPAHRQSGPRPLRGDQGRHQRLHPHLRDRVRQARITINAVEPGNIMTPGMEDQLGADYIRAQEQSIPIGRLGDPEDIAYAMLFLAGDEAKYITGQTIVVNGGQILPDSRFAVS